MAIVMYCTGACGAGGGASLSAGVGHWTIGSGTPSFQTTTKRTGSVGAVICAATAAQTYLVRLIGGSPTDLAVGFWWRASTAPSASTSLLSFRASGAQQFQLKYNQSTNQLFCRVNSVDKADDGPVIDTSKYYWIVVHVSKAADPWTMDVQITEDGGSPTVFTQVTESVAAGTFNAGQIRVGLNENNATGTFVYSDIRIDNDATAYPFAQLEGKLKTLNGDGTHNASANTDFLLDNTTPIDPSTTTSYQDVDDITQTTTRISDAAAASTEYLEWTTAADGDARDAVVLCVPRSIIREAAGTSIDVIGLYDGTSVEQLSYSGSNTSQGFASNVSTVAPSTSGAWTQSLRNALRLRWGLSSDIVPVPSIYGTLVEVAFEVGTSAVAAQGTARGVMPIAAASGMTLLSASGPARGILPVAFGSATAPVTPPGGGGRTLDMSIGLPPLGLS